MYDNSNDSDDYAIAKGRNYHQGPEWVWPMGASSPSPSLALSSRRADPVSPLPRPLTGYFLRAHLIFDTLVGAGKDDLTSTFHHIYKHLSRHRAHISSDPWAGLPELTNENGGYCHDSCRTQAWSASTLLDALDDMAQLAQAKANKA